MTARIAVLAALLMVSLGATAHASTWRLEQPDPPAGAPYPAPLGTVADVAFWAPNRGLLLTAGNAVVHGGLYAYDGVSWKPYATVCGAAQGRIAWAGPREVWTISDPAIPAPKETSLTLCHIVDGVVVASYAVPSSGEGAYEPMNAAACTAPDDCWFGGIARRTSGGTHAGTFHLHWDGRALAIVDGAAGRAATDMTTLGGAIYETLVQGARPESADGPIAPAPSPAALVQRISGGLIAPDPFLPTALPDVPVTGTDLLAADSDGAQLWVAGGGSASGPAYGDAAQERPPLLARASGGSGLTELTLGQRPDGSPLTPTERFEEVAAIPGTDEAWVSVEEHAVVGSTNVRADLLRVRADGTIIEEARLPETGQVLGAARRIACPAAGDCWMATTRGWLFHWTDGSALQRDDDPAFHRLITARPSDGRTPIFTPDTLPIDDSLLYAPPSDDALPAPVVEATATEPTKVKALLAHVKSKLLKGNILRLSFDVRRKARVGAVGTRGGKTVARAKVRTLKPGRRALRLQLHRKRWPTKLRFQTRELDPRLQAPTS
ncbi:MAG TPA: hypothetical protein VNT55_25885 [Baekduia sp.]|nr:hypothetical protein [Baekduia sp.]